MGASWFRQEYSCSFEALEGLVYPDFARCVVPTGEPGASATGVLHGRHVGGIDFGFRNPFAAVWGNLDRDGILWLTGEHYARQKPLSYHARHLPRGVTWYADPSGATERCELRSAGFTVAKGDNSLRSGIAAVTARLENGTLRILEGRCPNLLAEAALYRYSDDPRDRHAEIPVDEHNHALAALRYLISRLDTRQMAGPRQRKENDPMQEDSSPTERNHRPWQRYDNEALWSSLFRITKPTD